MHKELPPFVFGIMRIQDCGFMIEEAVHPVDGKMQIGYGMEFLFDVANSWIQYIIRVDFKNSDTNQMFMSGTVLTRFSVDNLNGFVDENNNVIFPDGSLETLFGIAFGHLRAILSKNISGSRFSKFYVPVINQDSLFNELLQANIERFKKMNANKNDAIRGTVGQQNIPKVKKRKTKSQ